MVEKLLVSLWYRKQTLRFVLDRCEQQVFEVGGRSDGDGAWPNGCCDKTQLIQYLGSPINGTMSPPPPSIFTVALIGQLSTSLEWMEWNCKVGKNLYNNIIEHILQPVKSDNAPIRF